MDNREAPSEGNEIPLGDPRWDPRGLVPEAGPDPLEIRILGPHGPPLGIPGFLSYFSRCLKFLIEKSIKSIFRSKQICNFS